MRTPNCECIICKKPLYRRPFELKKVRYVACIEHREEAKRMFPITDKQREALSLGSVKGDNRRTGTKHKDETKRKIAEANKMFWIENPDKLAERGKKIRGENHYNWKGGISDINKAVRLLDEYRRWVRDVKERDGKCLTCGTDINLDVHHKKPLIEIINENNIESVEQARECSALWDMENGQTICVRCHYALHGRKYSEPLSGRKYHPRKPKDISGEKNPNWKGGLIEKECPFCGIYFESKPVVKQKYCSRGCACECRRKDISANA